MAKLSAIPAKLVLFHTQTVTFPRSKIVPQKTNCTVLTFFTKKSKHLMFSRQTITIVKLKIGLEIDLARNEKGKITVAHQIFLHIC